jgi:hypothetical protein
MSSLWFQIFAVFHFLGSSFYFLPYIVAFIVSFCSCFFFPYLLSPYSPAIAHRTCHLTFFFLSFLISYFLSFLSPHVRGISLFIFVFFVVSPSPSILSFSLIWYILFYLFDPEGQPCRGWFKSMTKVTPIRSLGINYRIFIDGKKNSCYYPSYMFPNQFRLLLFSRFIFIKYFPIAVMYFPDIADPEGQL